MPLDGSLMLRPGGGRQPSIRGARRLDERLRRIIEDGDRLFSQKRTLDSLHQEIANNFYPEMAEFTAQRYLGEEFADNLTTSYPIIARRTLGDAISGMLRPASLDTTSPGIWFSITTEDERLANDQQAKRWLEWVTKVQRRAMYDYRSGFVKALKQGDHSFATFGQAPISLKTSPERDRLIYQCWHLKDLAWQENCYGEIDYIHRRWKTNAMAVVQMFGDKAADKVKDKLSKDPYCAVECRNIIIASKNYEERDPVGSRWRQPWVSIWVDVTNEHLMEEEGSASRVYIIPRWLTVPGCQYAHSPAIVAALPDARLIQAMSRTLLEAAEKFADPPMTATQEAIRSDVSLFPGGITWIDSEYDERLGKALAPIYQPTAGQGLQAGMQMRIEIKEMIDKALYLDSLQLPPSDVKEMTAYEVGQRISDWIRRASPLFEPVNYEYNAPLCEETFEIMLRNGAFGSMMDMPQILRGTDIRFKFESPLYESSERRRGQKLMEAEAILAQTAQLDPTVVTMLDSATALRDALNGIGCPPTWVRSDAEMQELIKQQQAEQQAQQMLMGMQAASESAANMGKASESFVNASSPQP